MSTNNSRQSIRSAQRGMLRVKGERAVSFTFLIGLLVAASTYFAFTQGVFSDEHPVGCGLEEHVHDEFCYAQPELICSLEEAGGHTHSGACFDESGLICTTGESPAHMHADECYYTELELVCGFEETEDDDETQAHRHSDECYRPTLICELEEHTHNADCQARNNDEINGGESILLAGKPDDEDDDADGDKADENEPTEGSDMAPGPQEPGIGDKDTETTDGEAADGTPGDNNEARGSEEVPGGIDKKPSRLDSGDDGEATAPDDTGDEEPGAPGDEEPMVDTEDPDDPAEGENEPDEEEPAEEDMGFFALEAASTRGGLVLTRNGPARFEEIFIPVIKRIVGEGGLGALQEDDDYHFLIRLEKIEDAEATSGVLIKEIKIASADFGSGGSAVVSFGIDITTPGEYFYLISEAPDTAGEDWIYDAGKHVIRVVVGGTGNVAFYDESGNQIGGITIASVYARMSVEKNNAYVEPEAPFSLESTGHYSAIPGADHSWYLFEIGSANVSPIYALCADVGIHPAQGEQELKLIEKRSNAYIESSLAYALFDIQYGAKLNMDEFNALFGFGSDEHPSGLDRIDSEAVRRGLIQYVIWFYELKYLGTTTINPRYNEYWSTPEQWDVTNPNGWPIFHPYPLYTGTTFRGYDVAFEFEKNLGVYYSHLLDMLLSIERMAYYYSSAAAGESITSYAIRYTPGAGSLSPGVIDIVQGGYLPPAPYDLILSWAGSVDDVVVESYDGGDLRDTNVDDERNYIKVRPGDTVRVYGVAGEITFTLTDGAYYLAGDSIRGMLFANMDNFPVGDTKDVYQRMLIGYADFVKLKASLTVKGFVLEFRNVYTMAYVLPETIGLDTGTFLVTGTMLILASFALLFTQCIKPVRQGIQDESRERLLSLIGKRTKRSRYVARQRE